MKTTRATIFLTTAFCLCLATVASGQRVLERAEILEILKELTSQPRQTWIPAGTIEATHEEYGAPDTTDAAKISSEIESQLRTYQSSDSRIELTEDLQKLKLDAIPFNVRYEMANETGLGAGRELHDRSIRFELEREAGFCLGRAGIHHICGFRQPCDRGCRQPVAA